VNSESSKPRKKEPAPNQKERPIHKLVQLFYLFGVVVFIFTAVALIGFKPEISSGDGRGWLGRFGASLAYFLAVGTSGRWGALFIPVSIGLMLAGRLSGWKFKPTRWVIAAIVAGFYVGFGIALARHLVGQAEDVILSGAIPLRLMEISLYYLYGFGSVILGLAVLAAFAVALFDFPMMESLSLIFYRIPAAIVNAGREGWEWMREWMGSSSPEREDEEDDDLEDEEEEARPKPRDQIPSSQRAPAPPRIKPDPSSASFARQLTLDDALKPVVGHREFPPLRLLDVPPPSQTVINPAELEENSRRLEEKLASLGVTARVIRTNPGPVITRYDLEPSADVKVSRIASLSDDIAMAMRARGVRILAPIPGEAAVGVEIPNRVQETVFIREVIGSEEFRNAKSPLTVALGKDASGKIFLADLAKMPHLLIAGSTGSGKSVCINTLLLSLLYRSDPHDVRLVLVDPKKLELSLYARLADQHLISPRGLGEVVITSPENAVLTLQSVHAEMSRRYDTLAAAGVRSLDEYNRWLKNNPWEGEGADTRQRLPYIVVVIDELADLMMTVRREFEELVVRLAQMARAVGIHLVVATQRPSVDVVTGLIKANFPSRIAFQVVARPDSRTILDSIGAEALLGKGDMLYMGPGSNQLLRAHGALSTTEEVERVVEFVRSQPPVDPSFQLPDPEAQKVKPGNGEGVDFTGSDEFFEEAARIVVKVEQGSISILQRRLRVGYSRAARLIDELEQAGIVGPFDGSKARQVLVGPEELRERYGIEI